MIGSSNGGSGEKHHGSQSIQKISLKDGNPENDPCKMHQALCIGELHEQDHYL